MTNETTPAPQKGHVPICAIGASAGGVHALRSLFRQLPDDLGLAYVVIVHLAPEHPSALAEILATCTNMGVHQVTDTPELRPNCVYVIPPDQELVIEGDCVHARDFAEPRGHRAPVDVFFRSVAAGRGDGLAVVLTGAGADGSIGVKAIHEGGGVVFAQEPSEAEFSAMPQNAIATGLGSVMNSVYLVWRMRVSDTVTH
ncbi:chemotaxis protein CheB [Loktanella sp. SALINAS62]|uniref:chemotaxis protein CheB n=1 Tax=Loktanella sp. SALINAS62 TaxID=2706124 RepID=UPI001B8CF7BE|nr:chemotaxis protein CheB [Loktanella sp. SALINAS62]MBS1304113.1 chemotaxis protein CheB [Loktanella sp. SALINAS62]